MNLILQYWNIMGYQNLEAYDSESTRYITSYQEIGKSKKITNHRRNATTARSPTE